ncbi:MAG TPA: hypothetical protein VN512_11430 [Clostridia bacterium]|nr:hypothetical protein [Clostridia bacterium]
MEFKDLGALRMEFRARDFRRIARDKLKGNWGLALGTSLLFMLCCWATVALAFRISSLLGADVPFFTFPFLDGSFYRNNLDYDSLMQYIYDYDSLIQYISTAMPAVGVYSLLALMLSLAATAVNFVLTLGHLKFYTDVCNNKAKFSTLFSHFRIFLKAFGLILFMRLFIFLWSLLLYIPGIIAYYRYSMASRNGYPRGGQRKQAAHGGAQRAAVLLEHELFRLGLAVRIGLLYRLLVALALYTSIIRGLLHRLYVALALYASIIRGFLPRPQRAGHSPKPQAGAGYRASR